MSVVITGGCGCIAQHLVRELIINNEKMALGVENIILLDVRPNWRPFWHDYKELEGSQGDHDRLRPYPTLEQEKIVKFYSVDLSNKEKLEELFENELIPNFPNLSTIFHVLSTTVLWSPTFDIYDKINVKLTETLLDISYKYDSIKNFIYTSSGSIFWREFNEKNKRLELREEEYQTVERDEKGYVKNVKLHFSTPPSSMDYSYVRSKQLANEMVVERTFRDKSKHLNTVSLALCMSIYGESEIQISNSVTQPYILNKSGGKGHNLYSGNAAYAHVMVFKAMQDQEKANRMRGLTYMIYDNNVGQLHNEAVRGIMKCVTGDAETYSEDRSEAVSLKILYAIWYYFCVVNFFVYLLTLLVPQAKKWYFMPFITAFIIDITYLDRYMVCKTLNAKNDFGYEEKYTTQDNYSQIALHFKILEKQGKMKLHRLPPVNKSDKKSL
ncbi:predicted protein [Naegleria gruberi]|uniref:Predicted protein n=1 Tax=Naegleria gruberi TaxID=5762 RepID=D2VMD4_NAEGR|nr:uncharacterized protein NAEGRDRAFT_70094 [Naegleria gruberi]EFC41968.1 predicted protein [Naegleria gruberi]|eukprot:XP_002674712.1 predicted protein [Naegleria gruberi strain NEG-M]